MVEVKAGDARGVDPLCPTQPTRGRRRGRAVRRGWVVTAIDRQHSIHENECMKTITINVSEPVYRDFQRFARARDRTASELIREAMEEFRERRIARSTTLADLSPVSAGRVLRPLRIDDDLLEEMLDDDRA